MQSRMQRDAQSSQTEPPNGDCRVAVLSGLLLSNLVGFQPGDLTPYFRFGRERVCVWTHTEHQLSNLVSFVDPEGYSSQPWKTLASCLEIAASLSSACEHIHECSYNWICDFRPKAPIDDQVFYGFSKAENMFPIGSIRQGVAEGLLFIPDFAHVLELLQRDDRFFIAAQHFIASIRNHWCCLTCELGADPLMHHPSHEPEAWRAVQIYPLLDIGMVQAYRAVETLLGKPADRNRRTVRRALQRWRDAVSIEPTEAYERVGQTFFDYFLAFYAHRSEAAHGRDRIPFSATRQKVIDAQCFAWSVLDSYVGKRAIDLEKARDRLEFDQEMLAREVRGSVVSMTYPPDVAARQRDGLRRIYEPNWEPPS